MMPGMPPGAGGAFDFSALQSALNDPSIKQMAEQIANDPSFLGLTQQLQDSMASMIGGAEGGGSAASGAGGAGAGAAGIPGMPAGFPGMPPGMPDPANFDPTKYMQAMSSMFQNPQFMQMAEKLGQAIIQSDPNMQKLMTTMADPEYKAKIENAMKSLKDDPEMGEIFSELEAGGPSAMMKYWNNPEVLKKLGETMGDVFDFQAMLGEAAEGADEEEEAEEEEISLHAAASDGNAEQLQQLLAEEGVDVDQADEEGRTALHFAVGYGEIECAKLLIAAKANVNLKDSNSNTPLHYAAGYGQADSVKLLLESNADKEAKNADDKTAFEVAELNEQQDVMDLLK